MAAENTLAFQIAIYQDNRRRGQDIAWERDYGGFTHIILAAPLPAPQAARSAAGPCDA